MENLLLLHNITLFFTPVFMGFFLMGAYHRVTVKTLFLKIYTYILIEKGVSIFCWGKLEHESDGTSIRGYGAFVYICVYNRHRRITTKRWSLLIKCN